MAKIPDALKQAGLKSRMLLQVHDELLFEATDDEVEATADVAKTVMEGAATLDEQERTREAWRTAADRTPHGNPIELREDDYPG